MAKNLKLSPYAYISLDEMKEYLKTDSSVTKYDNMITRFINAACARVEKYIDGPVLSRQFAETLDGNASNIIVPQHYPIQSIDDIRIDFNRAFTDATKLEPVNYVLHGMPTLNAFVNNPANPFLSIKGTDIVLRDDNNTAILGRIFSGSIVASIELKYTAGWGRTPEDIPADIMQATMMLAQYMYTVWDQNLLGIKSRESMGQAFTRAVSGTGSSPDANSDIPVEVRGLLDQYRDLGFGSSNVPQHNIFQL